MSGRQAPLWLTHPIADLLVHLVAGATSASRASLVPSRSSLGSLCPGLGALHSYWAKGAFFCGLSVLCRLVTRATRQVPGCPSTPCSRSSFSSQLLALPTPRDFRTTARLGSLRQTSSQAPTRVSGLIPTVNHLHHIRWFCSPTKP